jgi:hypothetical protein
MEPVVDPSLNQMFVGNMSPFREALESRGLFEVASSASALGRPSLSDLE